MDSRFQRMKKWFVNHRGAIAAVVFAAVIVLISTHPVFAQTTASGASPAKPTTVESVALWIAQLFSWVAIGVTKAIVLVIDMVVIPILHYNKFTTSPVVTQGWVVIRDLVNMFFVVILLVIAFQTIFNLGKADWKRQIPRLLIFAIVINFSRTIAGLCIDAGQVVMFTFVNAISNVAGGNFIQLFGLDKLFTFSQTYANTTSAQTSGIQVFDFFIASFLTMGLTFVILGTMLMLAAMLAFRIVILWCLVIVSPLTFFLGGAKGTVGPAEGYYAQWWKRFTGAITLGPILTFFVWLALAAASSGNLAEKQGFDTTISNEAETEGIAGFITEAFDAPHMTSLIIAISLLFAGFEVAQETASSIGGRAGKLMTAGVAGIPGLSATLAKLTAGAAPAAVVGAGRAAKAAAPVQWRLKQQEKLGSIVRGVGESMSKSGLAPLAIAGRATMTRGMGMLGDVETERKHHFDHAWKENAGLGYDDLKRIADIPITKLMTSSQKERIEAAQVQMLTQKEAASSLSNEELGKYAHAYHAMKGVMSDEMKNKIGSTILLRRPEMSGMAHGATAVDEEKVREQISTMSETPNSLKNINAASFANTAVVAALRGREFRYNDEQINALDWIRKYGNDSQKQALATQSADAINASFAAAKAAPKDELAQQKLREQIQMISANNLAAMVPKATMQDPDFALAFMEHADTDTMRVAMSDEKLKKAMVGSVSSANVVNLMTRISPQRLRGLARDAEFKSALNSAITDTTVGQMVDQIAPERLQELTKDPAFKTAMEQAVRGRDASATTPAQKQQNVVIRLKIGLDPATIGYDRTTETFSSVGTRADYLGAVANNPSLIVDLGDVFTANDHKNKLAEATASRLDIASINKMQSRLVNRSISQAERDRMREAIIQLEQALEANTAVADRSTKLDKIKQIRDRGLI